MTLFTFTLPVPFLKNKPNTIFLKVIRSDTFTEVAAYDKNFGVAFVLLQLICIKCKREVLNLEQVQQYLLILHKNPFIYFSMYCFVSAEVTMSNFVFSFLTLTLWLILVFPFNYLLLVSKDSIQFNIIYTVPDPGI